MKRGMFLIISAMIFFLAGSVFVNAQAEQTEIDYTGRAGITPDNPILWALDRAVERIQLLLTFNQTKKIELRLAIANERLAEISVMIAKNKTDAAEAAEKARGEEIEIIENLGFGNLSKAEIAEKPEEKEIANATNLTCGYCHHLVNGTCLNYACCRDEECKVNEYCSEHECVVLNCGYCQHVENRKCVDSECCSDEDCGTGQVCSQNKCLDTEKEVNFYFNGITQREVAGSRRNPRLYVSKIGDVINFDGYVITPTFCNNLTANGYLSGKNIFLDIKIDDNDCVALGKEGEYYNSIKATWFSGRYESLAEGDYTLILIVNGKEDVSYPVEILGGISGEVNISFETLYLDSGWESIEYTGPLIRSGGIGFYLILNETDLQKVNNGLTPKISFSDMENYFIIFIYLEDSCGPAYPEIYKITQAQEKVYTYFERKGSCKDVGDKGWHIVKVKRNDLIQKDNLTFIFVSGSERGKISGVNI